MNFKKNFSERLSYLRKSQNLSLFELGKILGVSDEAVRLMEKAKRSPSFDILCAISEFFNVSIDYLIGRTDNPKINK